MAMAIVLPLLAIVAALRGTWSPCGRSVLSTITPVAEQARGASFRVSATAYVVGGVIGGALLGGATAGLAAVVDVAAPVAQARILIAFVAVAVCVAADANLGGLRLPEHPRQVDQRWVMRLRPWAYGLGFGVQIGAGLATYVMTNAVYALVAVGVALCTPNAALLICTAFGLTRGLTVLVGAWATTPQRLRSVHAWLERTDTMSLAGAMGIQLCVLVVCAAELTPQLTGWVLGGIAAALGIACCARLALRRPVLAR